MVLSLGLGGIGLSYVRIFAPYQQYLKILAAISLIFSHYSIAKGRVGVKTEKMIWISTIMVIIILWLPAILSFIL